MSSLGTAYPPQYLRPWELSMDPFFDEYVASLGPPPLSLTHLCPIESQVPLSVRMLRTDTALRIQSLWRGYKVRKTLAEAKYAQQAAAWRTRESLDEVYCMCVHSQNLAVELHRMDPTWDATQTPWYIWMLTQGRYLESVEAFLVKCGWALPPSQPLEQEQALASYTDVIRFYKMGRFSSPYSVLPRPPSWSYAPSF